MFLTGIFKPLSATTGAFSLVLWLWKCFLAGLADEGIAHARDLYSGAVSLLPAARS